MKLSFKAFSQKIVVTLVSCLISGQILAQNYPFPQNEDYTFGIQPSSSSHHHAKSAYDDWKKEYYEVVEGTNRGRVIFSAATEETVSEGIAYGMLLASYGDDKEVFDRLWNYYQHYENENGVMDWRIGKDGNVTGGNGATDAEEDAAMGLIIAHYQWGSDGEINYMEDAKELIDIMMEHEVEKPSYVLKPGDAWGGTEVTNISYFAPAYYKVYYEITGDDQWLKVLDKCYEIIELNAHPETGLVSDWCKADGTPTGRNGFDYTFDASRFPWRMATDYLWYGDERAQKYCKKMSDFVISIGGTKAINGSGYEIDGTSLGGGHNPVFVASFATAALGTDETYQSHLNSSYSDAVTTKPDEYFAATVRCLSLFLLTGNFYRLPKPECSKPELGPSRSLCEEPSYTLSTGITNSGYNFTWSTGETSETITVNTPGTYWVKSDSAGCVRYDTVQVTKLNVDLGEDINSMSVLGTELSANFSGPEFNYLWNTDETTQSIQVEEEGTYWVEVDSLGCKSRDSINVSFGEADSIRVYPNPSNGLVTIMVYDPKATKIEVDVFDLRGQKVESFRKEDFSRGAPLVADLRGYAAGYYFFRIKAGDSNHVRKILIR